MKKATKLLAGAALIASLSLLSGCKEKNNKPSETEPVAAVYGPPPDRVVETEPIVEVYGPPLTPDQRVTDTPVAPVYGPPSDQLDESVNVTPYLPEETKAPETVRPADSRDPAKEEVEFVYGPPVVEEEDPVF